VHLARCIYNGPNPSVIQHPSSNIQLLACDFPVTGICIPVTSLWMASCESSCTFAGYPAMRQESPPCNRRLCRNGMDFRLRQFQLSGHPSSMTQRHSPATSLEQAPSDAKSQCLFNLQPSAASRVTGTTAHDAADFERSITPIQSIEPVAQQVEQSQVQSQQLCGCRGGFSASRCAHSPQIV
jgi:hypothetical protein